VTRHQLPGGHFTGWIPQRPDARDLLLEHPTEKLAAAQKIIDNQQTIDLRLSGHMPGIYDQLELGACTANSDGANLEYNLSRLGLSVITPSRLFIYFNERDAEGTVDQDSGATIRGSIQATAQFGAPDESLWPYDISKFTVKPPPGDYTSALADCDLKYEVVPRTETAFVACLADDLAVQIGFTVYSSFEEEIGSNGIMPWPASTEQVEGGHAVLVVGIVWINGDAYWICRNSWGTGWGDGGYFYMPVAYLITPGYASDYWQCSLVGKAA
jgi:C1A family cysteine protease